jgi:hypothetical protein
MWVAIRCSYGSVTQDGCSTPIDLVFLLDSSGSIEDPSNYGSPGDFVNKELAFVKAVVPEFSIGLGSNHTRVGVATFSAEARVEFQLGAHASSTNLLAAVDAIEYMGANTCVRKQLLCLTNLSLSPSLPLFRPLLSFLPAPHPHATPSFLFRVLSPPHAPPHTLFRSRAGFLSPTFGFHCSRPRSGWRPQSYSSHTHSSYPSTRLVLCRLYGRADTRPLGWIWCGPACST